MKMPQVYREALIEFGDVRDTLDVSEQNAGRLIPKVKNLKLSKMCRHRAVDTYCIKTGNWFSEYFAIMTITSSGSNVVCIRNYTSSFDGKLVVAEELLYYAINAACDATFMCSI